MNESNHTGAARTAGRKILVVDDSRMLLDFVKEILADEGYEVSTASIGEEGLSLCRALAPDVILLDFVLPDMKGDEVCRRLMADPATADIPVVYVSGFESDLQPDRVEIPNVKGSIRKPFTSETLLKAVRSYLPEGADLPHETHFAAPEKKVPVAAEAPAAPPMEPVGPQVAPLPISVIDPIPGSDETAIPVAHAGPADGNGSHPDEQPAPIAPLTDVARPKTPTSANEKQRTLGTAYFCGDSSFFSLHRGLQTIAREKLTGILRLFWSRDSADLLAREGQVVVVTTRNLDLYCEEAPVSLMNVDREQVGAARARQGRDGCPLFVTLAEEGLILREPSLQLVQHYGQKLFSQLWMDRVRFTFEQQELPGYADQLPASEENIGQWALSTLRFIQSQELNAMAMPDMASIPAYTRDGYDRVQELRLTVAEAQFASQFNGRRSLLQITKNLRLDVKFTRLTLFRFLALKIVECWPPRLAEKSESRRGLRGIFGR